MKAHRPHVETVHVIIRGDGRVQFDHPRLGERFEFLVSPSSSNSSFDGCPTLGPCPCEETTMVGSGNDAMASTQERQYTASDPQERSESRPQRSQYFISNTSSSVTSDSRWCRTICILAGLAVICLWALMRSC